MPAFLGLGPDNPITWSNFYRKGGFKSQLTGGGIYLAILGSLILISVRVDPKSSSTAYAIWSNIILGLQFFFIVIIGAGRISTTIRGDLNSGMIESLRMMPLPARHAIIGYLSASFATLAGFIAANFIVGMVMNALAQLPPQRWLAANAILLVFALFVWIITTLLAFLVTHAGAVLAVVSLIGILGQVGILALTPGLIVLAGPLIGGTIFNIRSSQTDFTIPLLLSIAAQFLIGAIFFTGATRKFRTPDSLALGAWLALALLLTVIGVSLLAILQPESFEPSFLHRHLRDRDPELPFGGSTILAMFVALIPLANFARLHVNWVRNRAADDPTLRRTVPNPFIASLIIAASLSTMLLALPFIPSNPRIACLAAALVGFSAATCFLAAWVYLIVDNAKAVIAIWMLIYCFLPMGIDLVFRIFSHDDRSEPMLGFASTFSPMGLLLELATQPRANLIPGAIFHLLIPILPITLYLKSARRLGLSAGKTSSPAH